MRLLLDTHVFLWYIDANPQLPNAFRDAIRDPANEIHLSVVSVWEAVIKHGLGKLQIPAPPADFLPVQRDTHQISSLILEEAALIHLAKLPHLHKDPFDRILIAQALQHGLTFVTMDDDIRPYPVPLLSP